jgi:hypothetical protein
MAIYIGIKKVRGDDNFAEYEFSRSELPNTRGLLKIEKSTGKITLIEGMIGDSENRAFLRASRKISLAWQEGKYPDRTCWAS